MNFQLLEIMNKIITLSAIALISGVLTSCNSSENTASPVLNINYPVAYVINGESSTMSIINLNTNELAGLVQLTEKSSDGMNMGKFLQYPHHVYLSPDKSTLAIAAPGMDLSESHNTTMTMEGKVALVDAKTGLVKKVIALPMSNHNVIYTLDGKEIWTSQMSEMGKVLVYDAQTLNLKNTIIVGKEPAEVTFSADGTVAFVANGMDNTVMAIDPNTKTILATIPVGKNPVGAWIGSDNRMYVDNEDGQSISIIEVKTLKVVETITLGFMPGFAAFHNDTKELWVTDPMNGKVHWWTYDTAMKMFMKGGSFSTAAGAHAIAFNNMTAYITNQESASLSIIDVKTHTKTKDLSVGQKPNGITLKL